MLAVEPTEEHRELLKIIAAVRRQLQWKARAGIRVLSKQRVENAEATVVSAPNLTSGSENTPSSDHAAASEAKSLEELRAAIGDCRRCKLWSGRTHLVFGIGHPNAQVMFVGEGPGRDEDL